MNFTDIYGNILYSSILGFFAGITTFIGIYNYILSEWWRAKIDFFFKELPYTIKSVKIKELYISINKKIDKKINRQRSIKWVENNPSFFTIELIFLSLLLCIIPGFISFIKYPKLIILGPFAVASDLFRNLYIWKKRKLKFKFKEYFFSILSSAGGYSFLSCIAFLILKDEEVGVKLCLALITSLLFGLYIYLLAKSIIRTKIFIHKCSYGQQIKDLLKKQFLYFIKSSITIIISVSIIVLINKLVYFENLSTGKNINIILQANKSYLITTLTVYGITIALQLVFLILAVICVILSCLLHIIYFIVKILSYKNNYLYVFGICFAYFVGLIIFKIKQIINL